MNHFTVVLALIETKVYNKKHFLCYEIQFLIVLNLQKKKKKSIKIFQIYQKSFTVKIFS